MLVLDNGAIRRRKDRKAVTEKEDIVRDDWDVVRYGVMPNSFDDETGGMLISDHRLVVAGLREGV